MQGGMASGGYGYQVRASDTHEYQTRSGSDLVPRLPPLALPVNIWISLIRPQASVRGPFGYQIQAGRYVIDTRTIYFCLNFLLI